MSPTTLPTALFCLLPALIAPAQAAEQAITWQNIGVYSPAEYREDAMQLILKLRPYTEGKILWYDSNTQAKNSKKAQGTVIELQLTDEPTHAYCFENRVVVCINRETAKTNKAETLDKFAAALLQCVKNGKLAPVQHRELRKLLISTYQQEIIDWKHIVLIGDNAPELKELLLRYTDAKIDYREMRKEFIADYRGLGDHYVELHLEFGYHRWHKEEMQAFHFGGSRTVPRITITYVPQYKELPTEEERRAAIQAKREAAVRRFEEVLQPLLRNGKLAPISVSELQKHFEKYSVNE